MYHQYKEINLSSYLVKDYDGRKKEAFMKTG